VSLFVEYLLNGIVLGALYALIALGYTMVYGIIQLINFAHGEIFMIGAFGALAVWSWGLQADASAAVALPLMLIGGIAASVIIAVIMERFAYRPLRNAPRLAPLITAIGVSITLQELVRLWWPVRRPSGDLQWGARSGQPFPKLITEKQIGVAGATISVVEITIVVVALVAMLGLILFVYRSRTGRAMQATAQDPDTARLMGINVDKIIVTAFVLGASLAGLAGLAQGIRYGIIDNRMGFIAGLKAFTAAVLGGIGNIGGAVLGGFFLGIVEAIAVGYMPGKFGGGAWKDIWAFIVLILVLVLRPQGLLGEKVRDRA
jgi:branched-chain amino acid transport system permease protein